MERNSKNYYFYIIRGSKTPGVDGIVWKTSEDKWKAIHELSRYRYSPQPLRRIYIPKSNGTKRPISIPTMIDRTMQTLYKFSLEPIAEMTGDPNSYGFRAGRCTQDAIIQCRNVLSKPDSPQWILEGDIKGCFDNISHEWVMEHIPMDKEILYQFLKSGYIESGDFIQTKLGTPQGSPISPVICNMVLDSLEIKLHTEFYDPIKDGKTFSPKVSFIRYADDFIVTGVSREFLQYEVRPIVEEFLIERGLQLSPTKTVVTNIKGGFDFLGWNVSKNNGELLITPTRKNLKSVLIKIENVYKLNPHKSQKDLDIILKPIIKGWLNYHQDVISEASLFEAKTALRLCLEQFTQNKL